MRSEALKRAQKKYEKANRGKTRKHYHLNYHIDYDSDIIRMLESQKNKNDYIRQLIAADIKRIEKGEI